MHSFLAAWIATRGSCIAVISITGNSKPGLQQFKGIFITVSTPSPLDQTIVFNTGMNSSLFHSFSLDLSGDCSLLGVYSLQVEP